VLLDDDVVTNGKAQASALSGRLGREERIEHLFLHVWGDAGAIVPDRYFNPVTKVLGRSSERRFVVASVRLRSALIRRVKPIRNQIEQNSSDVLREDIGLASAWIKRSFKRDFETLFLSPCPVIGKVKALLDKGIDIDDPVLARALARVLQHILDDGICTLAMLHDFVEIAPQGICQLVNFGAYFLVDWALQGGL